MKREPYAVSVCTDCYMLHHYGESESTEPTWDQTAAEHAFSLGEFTDWTCSDHEWHENPEQECQYCKQPSEFGSGITEFSWSSCSICQSALGGSRYRLAFWERESETQTV